MPGDGCESDLFRRFLADGSLDFLLMVHWADGSLFFCASGWVGVSVLVGEV